MSTTIRFANGREATLTDDGVWESSNTLLAALLEFEAPFEDPGGQDPDPILNHATKAAAANGAEVIASDDSDFQEDKVY